MFEKTNSRTKSSEKNHNHLAQVVADTDRFLTILVLLAVAFWAAFTVSANSETLSVPAQFEQLLTLPGEGNQLLRPSRIHVDSKFNEVFVADRGHNRILIFNDNGFLKFEIFANDLFGSPLDYTVNKNGDIFVLGTTIDGISLFLFDFDGTYQKRIVLADHLKKNDLQVSSICVDDNNNLYLFDATAQQVIVLDADWNVKNNFSVIQVDLGVKKEDLVFGLLYYSQNRLYLPLSSVGMVAVFNLEGKLIHTVGNYGALPGELNFPIGVSVINNSIVCVLDKNRFTVVCYDMSGKFLGEFGGRGFRTGWFYHPGWIAADENGYIYVGQTYNNMVQKCRIPDFILKKAGQAGLSEKQHTTTYNYNTPTYSQPKGNTSLNFGGFKHA